MKQAHIIRMGGRTKDTAPVIDRYCDVLFIRTFGQEMVDEFARYMDYQVINALTDQYHTCQTPADLLTIREQTEAFRGLKLAYAGDSGSRIVLTHSLDEAVEGVDVVVANTWHSMGGPEKTKEQRIIDFQPFQITPGVMARAKADAITMHCLPAYRSKEMVEEVIEGRQWVVFDEAENRLHTEKAVLYLTLA